MATLTLTGSNANTLTGTNVSGGTATSDDDTIIATASQLTGSTISGGLGNDVLQLSTDTYFSLSIATAVSVESVVLTAAGSVQGRSSNDAITGSSANDTLQGIGGQDSLVGNDGSDRLEGGDGNDTLWGGAGNDTLSGGNGNDVLVIESSDISASAEIYDGGQNTDTLWIGSAGLYRLTELPITSIEAVVVGATAGTTVSGGTANDSITGNIGDDMLYGASGNDALYGRDGNDWLFGEDGNDYLSGGTGADTLYGGDGDDYFNVYAAEVSPYEVVDGGAGRNELKLIEGGTFDLSTWTLTNVGAIGGGALDDAVILSGEDTASYAFTMLDGNDTVVGGAGNDTLSGGAGNDVLSGGAGNDIFQYSQGYEFVGDTIVGGSGTNVIWLSGTSTFNLATASISGIDAVIVSVSGPVAVTGSTAADVISGNTGGDRLYGGDGADTLFGMGGNDTLSGGAGNDNLMGGADNDLFLLAAADMTGSTDTLNGGDGTDAILLVSAGTYNFAPLALYDIERVSGSTGNDSVFGLVDAGSATAAFWVDGAGGNDALLGGAGDDSLYGGDGDDTLSGGNGSDTLVGNTGADVIYGGDGNDVFAFAATGNGTDLIADIQDTDTIRVAGASFSGTVTSGDGSSVAANSVQVSASGGTTTLHIDTDGQAGAAELSVTLTGTYTTSNFTLSGTDIAFTPSPPIFTPGTDTHADATSNALTTAAATGTINAGDNVDAGDGTDTLNATLANNETTGAATIAGFENLNLTVAGGNTATFNAQNVSSSTIKPVGAGTHTITNASVDVDASGLTGAGTVDATFTGGNVAATGGGNDDIFRFGTSLNANDTISGGAGNDTLYATVANLSGSAGTLRLSDVEVLDLTSSGSANQISLASATGLNTVKVAGTALFYLSGVGGSVTTIDAGTASGAQSITLANAADVLVKGGSGNDTFALTTTLTNADTISGGAGTDTLTATVASLDSTTGAFRLAGVETLSLTGTGSASTIVLSNATGLTTLTLAGSSDLAVSGILNTVTRIDGNGAAGALTVSLAAAADVLVRGGSGNDLFQMGRTLTSTDTVSGGAGDDTVRADVTYLNATTGVLNLSGVETLWLYGEGAPSEVDLSHSTGLATVDASGASGSLIINHGLASAVTITGGEGGDAITGGSGADVIGGFTGDDTLYGGAGADTLSGAAGNDTLYGGAGNDVFGYAATDAGQVDVIGDFAAGDVIRVGSATLGGITSGTGTGLAARGVQVGTTSGGFTPLYIDLDGNGGAADLTIRLAGSFTASGLQVTGNEISVYTPPPSTGGGGGGDSGGTTRTVDGVTVQQTTQTGSDGTRTETITVPIVTAGRTEENAATPNADIPLVTGTGGQELLTAHVPVGVGLTVESTTTTASGVQGLIRAIQNRTQDRPTDQQEMTGVGQSFLDVLPPTTNLTVRTIVPVVANPAAPPSAPIVITGTPTTPATGGGTSGGTEQQAVVIDVRNLPKGTVIQLQNVEFAAIVGAVSVTGGEGSQIVVGDGEDQVIVLGADDDTLRGGGGNDFVGSEGGDDVLFGDTGYDTVTGGIGNDALYGNQQDDVVYGNQGLDTLFGGQDLDTLFGGQDGDVLYGNRAADVLYGQLGSDTLFGGQDNDVLFGGQGDDLLAGNLGSDTLTGGLGADTFRIGAPQDGGDVIADFEAGTDTIAVAGPNFGNLPAGSLSASHFALDNPTSAGATFVFNTRTGVLSFDADGSGTGAAVTIATLNVRTLSHTDILVLGS